MKRPNPRKPRGKPKPPVPSDLGPVRFAMAVQARPRIETPTGEAPPEFEGGGLLAELPTVHGRGWKGTWTVAFGPTELKMPLGEGLAAAEELLVFILELVDAGYGEWTLYDREDKALILEAQVFGPDVNLEFGGEDGPPHWNGKRLSKKATVRLRKVVDQGTEALRTLLKQAARLDPDFGSDGSLKSLWDDLDALKEAVADLPRSFKDPA